MSVANGDKGAVPYNIGDIEERSFPKVTGSSAMGGALNGKTSFEKSVPQGDRTVKQRFSYAGENANNPDLDALARAKEMRSAGVAEGMNGNGNRILTNARLGSVIGEIVENAIPINALHNSASGVEGTYAMIGYAFDGM